MGEAQGKKVDPSAVAAQAIEAQPAFGQIKPLRGRVVRAPNSTLGRSGGEYRFTCTRSTTFQTQRKKPWRAERTRSNLPARQVFYAKNRISYVGSAKQAAFSARQTAAHTIKQTRSADSNGHFTGRTFLHRSRSYSWPTMRSLTVRPVIFLPTTFFWLSSSDALASPRFVPGRLFFKKEYSC
jgi:hypothetical protein